MTAAESTTQRDAANATSADAATATGAGAGASPPANSTARPSSRPSPGRLAGWVALAVVLLGALAFGTLDDGGARTPDERARIWPELTAKHTNYAGYQKKTDREIPVVLLDPV